MATFDLPMAQVIEWVIAAFDGIQPPKGVHVGRQVGVAAAGYTQLDMDLARQHASLHGKGYVHARAAGGKHSPGADHTIPMQSPCPAMRLSI
jgi:hypothetical protein